MLKTNLDLNSPRLATNIIYKWKGHGCEKEQRNKVMFNSKCELRIYAPTPNHQAVIIVSDIDTEDSGTSITNCAENLATLIWQQYKELIERNYQDNPSFTWIEHYPRNNPQRWRDKRLPDSEDFSLVEFDYYSDRQRFSRARWSILTPEQVKNLIK